MRGQTRIQDVVIARIAEPQGRRRVALGAPGRRALGAGQIDRRWPPAPSAWCTEACTRSAHRRLDRPALAPRAPGWRSDDAERRQPRRRRRGWTMRPAASGPVHLTLPSEGGRKRPPAVSSSTAAPLPCRADWVRARRPAASRARPAPSLDLAAMLERPRPRAGAGRGPLPQPGRPRSAGGDPGARTPGRRGASRRCARCWPTTSSGRRARRASSRSRSCAPTAPMAASRFAPGALPPYRADLFFEAQRLIVEIDGPAHRTPAPTGQRRRPRRRLGRPGLRRSASPMRRSTPM